MPTVTGLTAAAMQAIADASITGARLSGTHLVLTSRSGTDYDVGSVQGAQGVKGDTGSAGADGADGTSGATTAAGITDATTLGRNILKIANLAALFTLFGVMTIANLPSGSIVYVDYNFSTTSWPVRPTPRNDICVIWRGPSHPTVGGTGSIYPDEFRLRTS